MSVEAVAKRVLGFQLVEALTKEWRKKGTAGGPIFAWDGASGQVYRFAEVVTEEDESAKPGSVGRFTTWVRLEEVSE